MGSTTPPGGRRPPAPHRTAVAVLVVFYTVGLAGIAALLVSRTTRIDWVHLWATWTQPPIHHPAGYTAPRLPTFVKLPPAPVLGHTPRAIAWHTLPPVMARREPSARWSRRGTMRGRMAPGPSQGAPPLPIVRAFRPAPLPTWAPPRAPRQARMLTYAPPRAPRPAPMPTWTPSRAPMPTWAHPPDPSLPPECRPRNPVVVGQ
jgi:hypothetical protein